MEQKRVMVAMSGGVDSSVAALLLKEQGYQVLGVTMCLGVPEVSGYSTKCCGVEAINDAKKVADKLGIRHYVLDFSHELQKFVIDDFVSEYQKGRTPNPCARCNQYLKFAKLFEYSRTLDCDYFATGHYAKINSYEGEPAICRADDHYKDQTYFLWAVPKESIAYLLFPLADYTKPQIRKFARQANLPVSEKPESQDICFVDTDYKKFLFERGIKKQQGTIVDLGGDTVGTHDGISNFTLGQRSGLGIALGKRVYVVKIDADTNRVIVGDKDALAADKLLTGQVNKLIQNFPEKVYAKIRYGHKEAACRVIYKSDHTAQVVFEEKQIAITPGQSVVFYDGDVLLGGACIES